MGVGAAGRRLIDLPSFVTAVYTGPQVLRRTEYYLGGHAQITLARLTPEVRRPWNSE